MPTALSLSLQIPDVAPIVTRLPRCSSSLSNGVYSEVPALTALGLRVAAASVSGRQQRARDREDPEISVLVPSRKLFLNLWCTVFK